MIKLIVTIVILFLLTEFSVRESKNVSNNLYVIDRLNQAFCSKMKGVWVMTDYINEIQKNKSPLNSFGLLNGKGVVELSINGSLNNDTILCSAVINNHEKLNFTGCIQENNNSILTINLKDYCKDCHYEIGLDTIKDKIFMVLYRCDFENILLEKRYFTKVLEQYDKSNKIESGISRVVNETLLAGQYRQLKTRGKESMISFNIDGSMTGLEPYRFYTIQTDFLIGPTQDFDQIILERKDGKHQAFGLTIKKDVVYINQIKGNDEKLERLKLGKTKYTMIRK